MVIARSTRSSQLQHPNRAHCCWRALACSRCVALFNAGADKAAEGIREAQRLCRRHRGGKFIPFVLAIAISAIVCGAITWLNQRAANKIDDAATQLAAS